MCKLTFSGAGAAVVLIFRSKGQRSGLGLGVQLWSQ